METVSSKTTTLEILDVGPLEEAPCVNLGFYIGKRFSSLIQSRVSKDLILLQQLLPFVQTARGTRLVESLCEANKQRYPRYWDELLGIADGSGVPAMHIILLNFRKEILPFIADIEADAPEVPEDDCSDVLVVSDSMAIAAHNEDANVALVGHTYGWIMDLQTSLKQSKKPAKSTTLDHKFWFLVRARLQNGLSFTAYTYAGELPSCAFGFNSHGVAFTLDSVPPSRKEIIAGGIGRNFVSRDLLEATDLEDALNRIRSSNASVGHSYNLVDVKQRKILNVETASGNRMSIHEVGRVPFFHANAYLHLNVEQVRDDNSISRQIRAAHLPAESKSEILAILGDSGDEKYPIYMKGPLLYTLCTAVIDLDEQTMIILERNPTSRDVPYVLPMC